jgi:hypothetical protein
VLGFHNEHTESLIPGNNAIADSIDCISTCRRSFLGHFEAVTARRFLPPWSLEYIGAPDVHKGRHAVNFLKLS